MFLLGGVYMSVHSGGEVKFFTSVFIETYYIVYMKNSGKTRSETHFALDFTSVFLTEVKFHFGC